MESEARTPEGATPEEAEREAPAGPASGTLAWRARFLASTRGRVLALVRRRGRTAPELAEELGISANAVRGHLAALQRDGLVEPVRVRREGVGKPPTVYASTASAEELFPKAYDAVLAGLLEVLETRHGEDRLRALLRDAGRHAGRQARAAEEGAEPVDLARRVLAELGADVERDPASEGVWLRGHACPLGALVGDHPELCGLVAALLEEATGHEVTERCRREDPVRPRCAFLLRQAPG